MTSETDFLISRKNLKVSVYLILLRRDEGGGGGGRGCSIRKQLGDWGKVRTIRKVTGGIFNLQEGFLSLNAYIFLLT